MKKLFTILLSLSVLFSISFFFVEAQTNTINQPPTGTNTTGDGPSVYIKLENPFRTGDSLYDLVRAIIDNIVLPIGGVLAVLAFIYSGFLYVTAQGNQSKLDTAHKALLYTAIGTAVLLGSWLLANVIENTIRQIL